ncbi:MAG: sulfite exporter TauE/SafE family protein [Phycisphaerales bacterium]
MTPPTSHRSLRLLRPWFIWLALFYCGWAIATTLLSAWSALLDHWPIAVAMAAGSYVAGSTPMGGGTVGFPILVLLFDQPASLGRNFSFLVQSIGMTSASIFIICRRSPVAWGMLRWAMLGSLVLLPIYSVLLTPHVSDVAVKLVFACVWAAFGLMSLVKLREITEAQGSGTISARRDALVGLGVAAAGCVSAALTGVGVDMVIYSALVLLYRAEVRCAVSTSVILMAFNSLVGAATSAALGRIDHEAVLNWLAAAPIVALGAPLGALMLNIIPRGKTLVFVSILCLVQFVWTLTHERITGLTLVWVVVAMLALNGAFHFMHRLGGRWAAPASSRRVSGT